MKKYLGIIIFLMVCVVGVGQELRKVKIGDVEEYIKKSDHPILVSFWATWCAPCVEEIPWLQEGVEKHAGDSVELVLVSLDFPSYYPNRVKDFIKQRNFKATFMWLDETDADIFCPRVDKKWDGTIPVTLFVNNKNGYRKFMNRQMTDRQVIPEIKKMLAGQ